jgi:hypothetical protein
MTFSARELRQLALPLLACIALLAAGSGLITWAESSRIAEARALAAARADRRKLPKALW